MKNFNKSIGTLGESISREYLLNNGYKIIDLNFRCYIGEIDIIAKKDDIISFIEVKSRYYNYYGLPRESVTHKKQKTISKVAYYYIKKYNLKNYFYSFDVIEIFFEISCNNYTLNFIKDAFRI